MTHHAAETSSRAPACSSSASARCRICSPIRVRAAAQAGAGAGPYPDLDFRQLDSWIVIREDNTATFYVGKTDLGQGTGTAFRQIMSDELDIAYDSTSCVMGSTDVTVDQGGSGGSDALQTDGWPMRRVAAEARRVLLDMASTRFGVPVGQLAVSDGVIVGRGGASRSGHLRRADRRQQFNVTLTGKNIDATTGVAPLKTVQELKIVGQSPQRYDIPAKVDGSLQVGRRRQAAGHGARAQREAAGGRRDARQHRRVVGAQHSRLRQGRQQGQLRRGGVRARGAGDPRGAAAQGQLAEAGDGAVSDLRGSLRLHARRRRRRRSGTPTVAGNPDAAFAGAAQARRSRVRRAVPGSHGDRSGARDGRSVERSADDLLQRHEVVRPAQRRRAVPADAARPRPRGLDGRARRPTAAPRPTMPASRRRFWRRRSAGRCACSGCARKKRRGTPRARPTRSRCAAASTRRATSSRCDYDARAADHNHLGYNEHDTVLIAQLIGKRRGHAGARRRASRRRTCTSSRTGGTTTHVVALPLVWETPLRTGNLRDPERARR